MRFELKIPCKAEYPKHIKWCANRSTVAPGSARNMGIAGISPWDIATLMQFETNTSNLHWLVRHVRMFFVKPARTKWRKWIHFCWLELRQRVLIKARLMDIIPWVEIYVKKESSGVFIIHTEKQTGTEFQRYVWCDDSNAYVIPKEVKLDPLDVISTARFLLSIGD
jgi:hypothetical protein